jgi:integral membrane protein (TIGR01906 family)
LTLDRERITRIAQRTAAVLFILLVPVFLITTNVRWVINFPPLYSYGFDTYRIPDYTGIERDQLLLAGKQIRDYFNDDEEWLAIRVRVSGVEVANLFNEREVVHMRDVKDLVRGVYMVQMLTGLYLLAVIAGGFYLWRHRFWRMLSKLAGYGGGFTLALVVLVGLASLVGFDRLFLAFHLISFSNDFWQLDPRRDYLIAMFPEGFFFDATMLIAFATILEAAILFAAYLILKRRQSDRQQTRAQRRAATR